MPILDVTQENIALARSFALRKWQERAVEYGRDVIPHDLSGACKFCALFAQALFGPEVAANYDHVFVVLGSGAVIDLAADSEDVFRLRRQGMDPYRVDRVFMVEREFNESLASCQGRVFRWVREFVEEREALRSGNLAARPLPFVEDLTNACVRCGRHFSDRDVTITEEGPVCVNCECVTTVPYAFLLVENGFPRPVLPCPEDPQAETVECLLLARDWLLDEIGKHSDYRDYANFPKTGEERAEILKDHADKLITEWKQGRQA